MAMLAHLLGLLTTFIGPLIIYSTRKDESAYVRDHAAEALNFHLTLLIASIASVILMIVLIGFFLLLAIAIINIVLGVSGSIAASKGQPFRYPAIIRFVS
ncbi:DUF4870 domain-containing protein [Acrocarpospora macrocephala]|uniref:Membrane protein n=2 Tax=Acrocarpospora macrocephala TaxID=150177 RepID=A0A5M3WDQ8_9ACTN|nr:membrane protein [Acrocarpospora macrocephala]